MDYRREDMIDLNEENVRNIFTYCMATSETPKSDLIASNFFTKECNMPVPSVRFSKSRILEKEKSIRYLLGQLTCVHDGQYYIELTDGIKKYDHTVWTSKNAAIFSLYYLGCSMNAFPQFKPIKGASNFKGPLINYPELGLTLSPNDPNFPAWVEENKSKWGWE